MIDKTTPKDKLKSLESKIIKLQSKKKKIEDKSKDQLIKIIQRCNATKCADHSHGSSLPVFLLRQRLVGCSSKSDLE